MNPAWTWTFAAADGTAMSGPELPATKFPTQSDAESWLGEQWRELGEHGVASVTLYDGEHVVYGPMSLSEGS